MSWTQLTYRQQIARIRAATTDLVHDLGMPGPLKFILHGENTTFCLTHAGEKYLVRVHRDGYQSDAAIRSELMWLSALAQAGIRAPVPVRELQFMQIADAPEPRRVAIFKWTEGKFARKIRPQHAREYGRVLATLHTFVQSWSPPPDFERATLDVEGFAGEQPVMGGHFDMLPALARPVFERARDRIRQRVDSLGRGPDVFNVIHADLHMGNIVFTPDGAVPIDFDDTGMGYFLYDLAVTLGSFEYAKADQETHAALITAYREILPISDEHLRLIPAFRALRMICITLWVLQRAGDHPTFRDRREAQINRAVEHLTAFLADG